MTTPWDEERVSVFSVYPQQHVTWSPAGTPVAGVSSRLAFQVERPDGKVVLSEFPVEAVPFQAEKQAQWESEMEYHRRSAPRLASQIPPVPANKPVFHQLLTSSAGEIWIRLSTPSDPDVLEAVLMMPPQFATPDYTFRPLWKEPLLFAVFSPEGRFTRAVRGGSSDEVQAVVGDTVWAVRTGSFGEESVVRLLVKSLTANTG